MKRNLLLLALAATATAQAQLIVANDSTADTMYSIDLATNIATPLNTGGFNDAWGMAADNVNGILYWNDGGSLHSASFADILAGTAAPTTTALTFGGSSTNFVGLGFNPTTGMLLGTRNIATEAVYEIDPVTGVATQLYAYPTTYDFGGVDFDAVAGELYGLSDPAATRGLWEIDYTGSTQTLKAPYPGAETDIDGLATNNGVAYYVTDGNNTTQPNFYVFDIATGTQTGTIASPFLGSGTFSAGAYAPGLVVPEPSTIAVIGLGLAALVAMRRKR